MRFWDSSAIVPLITEESSSQFVLRLYREDDAVIAWWGTSAECVSAIARVERDGRLPPHDVSLAVSRLEAFRSTWNEIQPLEEVLTISKRVLRSHPLRTADSFQLGALIVAQQQLHDPLSFVCLDERLGIAAEKEGFRVLAPI